MTVEQSQKAFELNRVYYAKHKVLALTLMQEENKQILLLAEKNSMSAEHKEQLQKKIYEYATYIQREIDKMIIYREEVTAEIEQIENEEYKTILMLRYIAFKKSHEIAEILNYSRKTIVQKHKKALDILLARDCKQAL